MDRQTPDRDVLRAASSIAARHPDAADPCPAPDAESLGNEIATLCSALYAAKARLLERLHRFDAADCAAKLGFHSTAHWLNYRCGIGMNAAREKVRVANALPGLPKIRAAFQSGRMSYSKVRAMTRIADADNEADLLSIATYGTAHHVEKLVSLTRRARRLQNEATTRAVYEERALSVRYDEDGAMRLEGRLPPEQGALIVKALEMAMDLDWQAGKGSGEAANDAQHGRSDVTAKTSPRVPIATRRADALAAVAEAFLNHPENSGSTADRHQIVVHVAHKEQVSAETRSEDVTAEASTRDVPSVTPQMEDGVPVSAETARRIACDCSILPVKETSFGEPLSIGRRSRSIPPAIRRALQLRDGGCRFPGCTHTRFVDGHHIVHWAKGGETSLENLVLLCRTHHRLVHEGGFCVERRAGGEIVFLDRGETPLPDPALLPAFGDNLDSWIDRQIFEADIDHETCRARLDATDRMDWGLAVAGFV